MPIVDRLIQREVRLSFHMTESVLKEKLNANGELGFEELSLPLSGCIKRQRYFQQGFSLVEIAIALFLMSILLTGLVSTTGVLRGIEKTQQQQLNMLDIHAAMLTYLKVNKHLPCPDVNGDGKADRVNSVGVSVCQSRSGQLPTTDLSLPEKDAWGNFYYYQVNARTESSNYVNNVCQTASAFGLSGSRSVPNDFGYCPSEDVYYCQNCSSVCSTTCVFGGSVDFSGFSTPPYMTLTTPPVGVDKAGSGTNSHKNLWLQDENGNEIDNGILYMVVSYGADGLSTWNNCNLAATTTQKENCNGDEIFSQTSGDKQDFLDYMTVLDVKRALLEIKAIK